MIRHQEQVGGILEAIIVRKPDRIGMTVWADDGQILDALVKPASDVPLLWIRDKKPVRVELEFLHMNILWLSVRRD